MEGRGLALGFVAQQLEQQLASFNWEQQLGTDVQSVYLTLTVISFSSPHGEVGIWILFTDEEAKVESLPHAMCPA